MNEQIPLTRSAEPFAEQLAQLRELCWYGGIPPLSVSAQCAAKIFPGRTPQDRVLHNLVWSVRAAIFGLTPCRQTSGAEGERFLVSFTAQADQGAPLSYEVAVVALPTSSGHPRYHLCLPEEANAPDSTRPIVLVVEDEPIVAEVERLVLESAGFAALLAPNGRDGLSFTKTKHPVAIILDLDLPDLCGSEFCRRLKACDATRRIPVIVCSGHPQARGIAHDIGADDFVAKPGEVSQLAERVRRLLLRG